MGWDARDLKRVFVFLFLLGEAGKAVDSFVLRDSLTIRYPLFYGPLFCNSMGFKECESPNIG